MTVGISGAGSAVPAIDVEQLLAQVDRGTPGMAPYPEIGGNRVRLITTPGEFYDDLRRELVDPELRTLNISEYAWYRNGFGAEATDLVHDALRRGVDVASTTDMMGTRSKFGSFQQQRLARAGAEVAEHRPWMGSLADHRKLFVINGSTMYLTGVGLGSRPRRVLRRPDQRWRADAAGEVREPGRRCPARRRERVQDQAVT